MTAGSPRAALRLDVPVPDGWVPLTLSPPDLSQVESVAVLSWHAWGPPGTTATGHAEGGLVAGCFGGETGAWTPEAEPIVLERLEAVVSSAALRLAGVGGHRVVSTERTAVSVTERIEGAADAEGLLVARSFLGFTGSEGSSGELAGCFALCVKALPACASSVEHATVDAPFVAPPHPTLAVRALVAAVHHPSATAVSLVLASCAAAALALLTRRRPRAK